VATAGGLGRRAACRPPWFRRPRSDPIPPDSQLILRDHNGFAGHRVPQGAQMKAPVTPMRFRNIWLRRL